MSNGEERFVRIEERLAAIERALRLQAPRDPRPSPPPVVSPSDTFQPASQAPKASSPSLLQPPPASAATSILGWGGMAAFVLATAYLIRLAMDAGWLTPTRQVGLAAIFGLALIASGFVLQRRYDGLANKLAKIHLERYPGATEKDAISVTISYGYDIGIASTWQNRNYSFSPDQWKERMKSQSNSML